MPDSGRLPTHGFLMRFSRPSIESILRVTPHRRVCGTTLLVTTAVLAPNLHFATAIGISAEAATRATGLLYALFVAFALLPRLQRVSEKTSFVVLFCAVPCVFVAYGCEYEIKHALASAVGMFDDRPPWVGVPAATDTNAFTHPRAGYSLRVPEDWQRTPGPIEGYTEFTLRQNAHVAAILRPGCRASEEPLAMLVRHIEEIFPDLQRTCSHWRGLETCLLRHPLVEGVGERWNWIAREPNTKHAVDLTFLVYNTMAEPAAYAIMNSLQPAMPDFPRSPCPVPLAWAAPFPNR